MTSDLSNRDLEKDTLKNVSSKIVTGESVTLNQIQTINCPNGDITLCGTYTKPTNGNYNVYFTLQIYGF